jgi:maltose alpha-D-glucosyltransferase/alpha-amylase
VIRSWEDLRLPVTIDKLMRYLPRFLETRRWYRGKGRRIAAIGVQDIIVVTADTSVVVARIDYTDGEPAFYLLPLAIARGEAGAEIAARHSDTAFMRVRVTSSDERGVLYGGLWNPEFGKGLLRAIAANTPLEGTTGELIAQRTKWFDENARSGVQDAPVSPSKAEQTNSSIVFGDRYILKVFRKVETGINPDAELTAFLGDHGFRNAPRLLGILEYRLDHSEPMTAGILQEYIPNQGDAWKFTLDHLQLYYEHAQARTDWERLVRAAKGDVFDLSRADPPPEVHELLDVYLESARLLGRRTAEMHLALTDADAGPDFRPEPFSDDYRQGLYYGALATVNRTFDVIAQRAPSLAPETAELAYRVLAHGDDLRRRLRRLRETRINALRIRHHGTLHLGQVLYNGRDFYFIDFEGDPGRPLSERRLKRSSIRDVAGMLRSFEYAAYTAIYGRIGGTSPRPELLSLQDTAAVFWSKWAGAAYLNAYLASAGGAPFVPAEPAQLKVLLDLFLIERAMFEVAFELEHRQEVIPIALRGVLNLFSE